MMLFLSSRSAFVLALLCSFMTTTRAQHHSPNSHRRLGKMQERLVDVDRFKVGTQIVTTKATGTVITTANRDVYRLREANVFSMTSMFSPHHYYFHGGNETVVDKQSGQVIPISTFRAHFPDGTVIQFQRDVVDRACIVSAEIHKQGQPVTYIKRRAERGCSSYTIVMGNEMSEEEFLLYGDSPSVPDDHEGRNMFLRHGRTPADDVKKNKNDNNPTLRHLLDYVQGDGSSRECHVFKSIEIAIAYDADFCQLHGGYRDIAEAEIQSIVAGSSLLYENDMCFKLVLTKIIPPDSCDKDPYEKMNRKNPCTNDDAGDHFLLQFSKYMRKNRFGLGIDHNAAIHLFTGFNDAPTNALGCSWKRTYCDDFWSYGINYMSHGFENGIGPAIVIFSHELAHTLGAEHYQDGQEGESYIMTPHVTSGNDGFNPASIHSLLGYLDKVKCDVIETNLKITATALWPNNDLIVFFTRDNTAFYSRYELDTKSAAPEYPRPAAGDWHNWPAEDWYPTAAFVSQNEQDAYFIRDEQVLRYSVDGGGIVGGPEPLGDRFPGLVEKKNHGGVLFPDGKLYFFHGNGKYTMFNTKVNSVGNGYPKYIEEQWSNWPSGFEPTAGYVTWSESHAYFFGTMEGNKNHDPVYIRYNIRDERVEDGYPKSVIRDFPGVFQ